MIILRRVSLCAALLFFSMATGAAEWQTTDFEIMVAKPNTAGRAAESAQDLVLRLGVDQAEILKMEHFLHDVAVQYSKMGFADPVTSGHLGPVVEELIGDRQLVRVYLLDIPAWNVAYTAADVGLAYYINGVCDRAAFGGSILIHQPAAFTNGRITDATYQSLAHELFHAVQAASRFKQGAAGCSVGKWITEGTADAIGFDMGRKLRGLEYSDYNRVANGAPLFFKLWGGRRYHTPLPEADPSQSDEYFSSSFWRHLAEVTWAKKHLRPHPGAKNSEFDYRYLADLFKNRLPGNGTTAELQWVGDWIKGYQYILEDLSRVYAQFTTSIADFMGEGNRMQGITGLPAGYNEERWRKRLFGACEEISLSKGNPGDSVELSLKKAAAACIKVSVSGLQGPVELVFQELSLSKKHQEQLRLGAIGGELVGSPFISECKLPGRELSSCSLWRLPGSGEAEHVFVISNMDAKAEASVDVEPRLHVSIPTWDQTSTQAPAASTGSGKQPKTRADVEKIAKQIRARPSKNSAMAAMSGVEEDRSDPSCTDKRKDDNLCGPQVSVVLTRVHLAHLGPGYVGGAGGMLNQWGPAADPGDDEPGDDEPVTMIDLQEQALIAARNTVNILIPKITYGFEGSIDNALVSVPDGRGDSHESVEGRPNDDGEYVPNGSVNIAEYTPYMLRGTFNAQLRSHHDMMNRTDETSSLPVVGEAEGSFTVSAPWRGADIKPDVGTDSLMMKDMAQDMISILQKMPPDLRQSAIRGDAKSKLCELGITGSQLSALGIPGGCIEQGEIAGVEERCSCTCADYLVEKDNQVCRVECSTPWESYQCAISAIPETGEKDAETLRFEVELRELSRSMRYPLQENAIAGQVYIFQIASPEQRQSFWDELASNKLQLVQQQEQETVDSQRVQNMSTDGLDEETLRYKTAVEQLNIPPDMIEDLVEMFQANDAAMREVLWQRVRESPLRNQ